MVRIGLKYGLLLGSALFVLDLIKNQVVGPASSLGLIGSLVFLIIVGMGLFMALRAYRQSISSTKFHFGDAMIVGFTASLVMALMAGSASYLQAAWFDPTTLDQLMAAARENWAANNYTPEAIASQAEHKMYSSPLNWAISGAKFMFVIGMAFSLVIAGGIKMRETAWASDSLRDSFP